MRGFLKGVSLGGVIAVGGIGVLSQLAGPEAVRSPLPQADQGASPIPSQAPDPNAEATPGLAQESAAQPQPATEPVAAPDKVAVEVLPNSAAETVTAETGAAESVAAESVAAEQEAPVGVDPAPEQDVASVAKEGAVEVPPETVPAESVPPEPLPPEPVSPPEADPVLAQDIASVPKVLADTPPVVVADAPTSPESNAPASVPIGPTSGSDAPPMATAGATPVLPAEADATFAPPAAPVEPPARPPVEPPADQLASADTGVGAAAEVPAAMAAAQPSASLPLAPGAPVPESAPEAAELPPPPPLTPREEALLQPLPDAVVDGSPEPDPAPQAHSTEAQGADVPLPDVVLQPEAPAVLPVEPSAPLPRTQGLTDQAQGVVTGRLPRIGVQAPAAETVTDSVAGTVTDAAPADTLDLPPLQRFSRPFENPDAKPLFAILLVDDGKDGVDRRELASLTLPLTIVIDPLSEGAAERAAIWRAGGQEVVLAASGIPDGATAADLEQTFQLLLERLPEALAVIDPDGRIFQDDRPLASMVVPLIQAEGMGLVTFDRGLNAADQVARREGVGAARIFRILDAEDEAAPVIRRYLDRAAFKAAQEGQVSVIGDLRSETVKAIMEWAVEGRSATVALAPVSAIMMRR